MGDSNIRSEKLGQMSPKNGDQFLHTSESTPVIQMRFNMLMGNDLISPVLYS